MKRRRILALGGSGALLAAGGVYWALDTCGIPADMDIQTTYVQRQVLTDAGTDQGPELRPGEHTHRWFLVENRSAATQYLKQDSEVWPFVAETNFADHWLLLVQTVNSSTPHLTVDCLRRTENGIDLTAELVPKDSRTDDVATHTLVVRINEAEIEQPSAVSVTVTGHDVTPLLDRILSGDL